MWTIDKNNSLAERVIELALLIDRSRFGKAVEYMAACCHYYAYEIEKPQLSAEYVARQEAWVLEEVELFLKTGYIDQKISVYMDRLKKDGGNQYGNNKK